MKFSACIEMLYTEEDAFAKRIGLAKRDGFDGFEFWGWAGKNLTQVEDAMGESAFPLAACCVDSRRGPLAEGLLRADNANAFADRVAESAQMLKALHPGVLIVTTGQDLPALAPEQKRQNVITCLTAGARAAEEAGITLVVEPLNVRCDHKGYYLTTTDDALEILTAVNSPRVKLLFDVYHQQITEGNLTQNLTRVRALLGHVHIADVPGRHEPGTGEIRYAHILSHLAEQHYDGFVGCEFAPSGASTAAARAVLTLR